MIQFRALLLLSLFAGLSNSASAQFSVSGGASLVPLAGAVDGTYPGTLPTGAAVSTVVVPSGVVQIDSVEILGLQHIWMGDLQMTLRDPNGVEHLIFVRPGYLNTSIFGNSGDFVAGNFTFVESGAPNNLPTNDAVVNLIGGEYNQSFVAGTTPWNSGTAGIYNTPMKSITGPSGVWTLVVYDWYVLADSGSFSGWTLKGNGAGSGAFCFGDGSINTCPCGNNGALGEGCVNGSGLGGKLTAIGNASLAADTVSLRATQCAPNQFGLFFQGNQIEAAGQGILFGDGLRCAGGQITRLQIVTTSPTGGAATSVSLSVAGNIGGQTLMYYQYWFRDAANGPCSTGFNLTNAIELFWN